MVLVVQLIIRVFCGLSSSGGSKAGGGGREGEGGAKDATK